MYRIMTVCTGNICRSPVGEYLIRQHAQEAGVPVTVTSSGISNEEEGNRIDPRAAAQLAAAEPEAATATMLAQLECHALGAPDKDSWNLEPWRPEVSEQDMVSAGCNPGGTLEPF